MTSSIPNLLNHDNALSAFKKTEPSTQPLIIHGRLPSFEHARHQQQPTRPGDHAAFAATLQANAISRQGFIWNGLDDRRAWGDVSCASSLLGMPNMIMPVVFNMPYPYQPAGVDMDATQIFYPSQRNSYPTNARSNPLSGGIPAAVEPQVHRLVAAATSQAMSVRESNAVLQINPGQSQSASPVKLDQAIAAAAKTAEEESKARNMESLGRLLEWTKQNTASTKLGDSEQGACYPVELVFPRRGRKNGNMDRRTHEPILITMEVMMGLFHLPLLQASKQLGLSPTAIKSVCRRLGIPKWPFRALSAKSKTRVRNRQSKKEVHTDSKAAKSSSESCADDDEEDDGNSADNNEDCDMTEAANGLSLLSAAAAQAGNRNFPNGLLVAEARAS